ncbi:MAG: ion channel [Lachnospiraceae bacterium]|nr:ion channel [Lachnospiraceae bacterium]
MSPDKNNMKRNRRFYIILIACIFCVYMALLLVLIKVEIPNKNSTINTIGDAVWYSIVTLTTVGYGDITPGTLAGRMVGLIFLLLSTGILVTLVSTVLSFMTSEGLPLFLLSFKRKRDWYYFADTGLESNTLAGQIYAENPSAVIIFGCNKSSREETPDFPCTYANVSPERIAKRKRDVGSRCRVFFMTENDIGQNPRAVNISALPVDVYARTTSGEDNLPGAVHFFHSYDCCAREYWRNQPLKANEHTIVLLGFGNYGQALLTRAILGNVISPEQRVAYHIFGDVGDFLDLHVGLGQVFEINNLHTHFTGQDSLIFHSASWSKEHALLESADRIIICDDDEQAGWDIFWKLRQFYRVRGDITLRSNRAVPGVTHFGTDESIYSPENVLRTTLNQVAIAMNNLYRSGHGAGALDWDELGDYLRQSKIAASEHLFHKVRILLKDESLTDLNAENMTEAFRVYQENIKNTQVLDRYRRIEHLRWLRFYAYYNWSYGPRHDEALRQDPRIRAYDELPEHCKADNDYSWELLGEISV